MEPDNDFKSVAETDAEEPSFFTEANRPPYVREVCFETDDWVESRVEWVSFPSSTFYTHERDAGAVPLPPAAQL